MTKLITLDSLIARSWCCQLGGVWEGGEWAQVILCCCYAVYGPLPNLYDHLRGKKKEDEEEEEEGKKLLEDNHNSAVWERDTNIFIRRRGERAAGNLFRVWLLMHTKQVGTFPSFFFFRFFLLYCGSDDDRLPGVIGNASAKPPSLPSPDATRQAGNAIRTRWTSPPFLRLGEVYLITTTDGGRITHTHRKNWILSLCGKGREVNEIHCSTERERETIWQRWIGNKEQQQGCCEKNRTNSPLRETSRSSFSFFFTSCYFLAEIRSVIARL